MPAHGERVAICIPCFNASRFLPELAASIAAQTRPFDEVILYDDASTDDSVAVARALILFTTIVRGEVNLGPGPARNKCLERTTADWIHFQDADDLMAADYLERCMSFTGKADVVIASGRPNAGLAYDYSDLSTGEDPIAYCLRKTILGSFGLYRRSTLVGVGGFASDLAGLGHEDPDLHVRLAAAGARFVATSEQLILHRQTPDSFSLRRWDLCLLGAVVASRRWLRDLPPRYHPLVVRGLELTARECDRAGFTATADRAWSLAKQSGIRLEFPSRYLGVQRIGRWVGPDVLSALRRGRVGSAWRRLTSRTPYGPGA